MTRGRVALLVVTGLLVVGLAVPAVARHRAGDAPRPRWGQLQQEFSSRLADELDLPANRVAEAVETVKAQMRQERRAMALSRLRERLDRAVEHGRITREEADALLERAEEGDVPGHWWRGRRGAQPLEPFGRRGPRGSWRDRDHRDHRGFRDR